MSNIGNKRKNRTRFAISLIIIISVITALLYAPVYSAAESAGTQAPADAPAATTARKARTPKVSLADAAATAEKMYYCGELYVFAESMNKANIQMAAIAEDVKESLQNGSLTKSKAKLNALTAKYNKASDTYNSWVDVKADLEYFIEVIGTRNAISKSQLQTAYKRTLASINDTRAVLESAKAYYGEQTAAGKRELSASADKLITVAASAVKSIAPISQKSLSGYRSLFDQFATQSGLKIEYKTWQNPEVTE